MKLFQNIQIEENGQIRMLYEPQEKQLQFHRIIDNRAENGYRKFFYGGAAKGGKSYCMRWHGIKDCIEYPGLRILLIRQSLKQLRLTHLDFIRHELPSQIGIYNEQMSRVTFSNNSLLQFGYLDAGADVDVYLGTSWDVIMTDELTTMKFDLTLQLMNRLTASRADFIPYFMAASNPGSIAHLEVKSYFIDKDFSKEFPELTGKYKPDQIYFLPARVYDNPRLIEKDAEIVERMEELPERERRRFLEGDWDYVEGNFFDMYDRQVHVVKPFNIPEHWAKRGGLDYGNVTCCELMAMNPDTENIFVYNEITFIKESKEIKAQKLKAWLDGLGESKTKIVSDTNIKATYAEMPEEKAAWDSFVKAGIKMDTVSKRRNNDGKLFRHWINDEVTSRLDWKKDENGLWIKRPKLYFMEGRCPKLIKTLPALIVSESDIEDYDKEQDKTIGHWTKAMQYGLIDFGKPISSEEQKKRQQKKNRRKYSII
jgi:hypothetical protein